MQYTPSFELAQPCVFVKQLPGPILCASPQGEDPLSLSYGASLPSSLAMSLSSALVFSTRPPVSVCGTGAARLTLRSFSRESGYRRCLSRRGGTVLSGLGSRADLPARSAPTPLQRALPSARGRFTPPSLRRSGQRSRNVDRVVHRLRLAATA